MNVQGEEVMFIKKKNNQELQEIKTLPIPEEKPLSKEL